MSSIKKDENYIERERITNGLFSTIYKSFSKKLGKVVALKITEPDDEVQPHNSKKELEFLQTIKKDASENGLLEIVDSYRSYDELVMVFEYYPYTLDDLIKLNSRKKTVYNFDGGSAEEGLVTQGARVNTFPQSEVKAIFKSLASSLSYLHQNGIIHRDLKPANIFFSSKHSLPILGDFGISWVPPDNNMKETSPSKITDVSTGIYKAPELCFGITAYTEKIDIWSLGIILTVLYSANAESIVDNEGNFSDLALIGSLFENFGTPTIQTWPEVNQVESFKNFQFMVHNRKQTRELLPRCEEESILEIFNKMLVFNSGYRIAAHDIVHLLNTD